MISPPRKPQSTTKRLLTMRNHKLAPSIRRDDGDFERNGDSSALDQLIYSHQTTLTEGSSGVVVAVCSDPHNVGTHLAKSGRGS